MKTIRILFLLCAIPLLCGMGSLKGDSSPEKIPVPAKKFTVTFIDQADVITQCRDASIEGGTFIEGKRGEGTYAVSFDNIAYVLFHSHGGKLLGKLKLRDNTALELVLQKNHRAYGHTKHGTFQIKLLDLKKMVIGETSPPQN
jgi:hypothetical protein